MSSPFTKKRQEAEALHQANQATSLPGDPLLLPGELPCSAVSQVTLLDPFHGSISGTLHCTNYKLFFRADSESKDEDVFTMEIPLGVISSIEKVGRSKKKDGLYGLELHCKFVVTSSLHTSVPSTRHVVVKKLDCPSKKVLKVYYNSLSTLRSYYTQWLFSSDMRSIKFALNQEEQSRKGVYEKLHILAFPVSQGGNVFAYHFRESYPEDGWNVYDAESELKRMGIGTDRVPWRITCINQNYGLCETYPAVFAVPRSVKDDELEAAAMFRSRNRMPALSWLHPVTFASITRCSQPLVGPGRKRSQDDENYFQAIFRANKHSHKLYIVDARPRVNALVNIAMGGGYELDDNYPNTEFSFLDIENIHVMRDSLKKIKEMVYPSVDDVHFLSNLENTRWLDHIKTILSGAVRITELIEKNKSSVLIHCTDGWDRTAQLSSLAMLMLDPYYRTIRGLEILIEKEWLSFGHKFSQRIGHGDRNHNDDQRAPVFLQFIDCVWQMTRQFPCAFEFNELFLITIVDHIYSCLFGTFLCNSEKARSEARVKSDTVSLWSFTNSQLELYQNPLYSDKMHQHVLYPLTGIRHLHFWTGYYIRWNPRMRPQEVEIERHRQLQFLIAQLKNRYDQLLASSTTKEKPVLQEE